MREPHHPSCEELELPATTPDRPQARRRRRVHLRALRPGPVEGTPPPPLPRATRERRGPNPPRWPQANALPTRGRPERPLPGPPLSSPLGRAAEDRSAAVAASSRSDSSGPAATGAIALRAGPSLHPRLDVRAGSVWPLRALPDGVAC